MVNSNQVYVVMEGSKIGSIYRYRDDAVKHAEAVGGAVIVQAVKNELPSWVQVMVDSAITKAQQQSGRNL